MAAATVPRLLSAKAALRGEAPVVAKQSRKAAILGRKAMKVENLAIRLVHLPQTTQQKIASMSTVLLASTTTYEAHDIDFHKSKLVVGADTSPGTTVDVLIPVDTVSNTHCELTAQPDRSVLVKDLNSTNGTTVDGVSVKSGDVVTAFPGQVIGIDDDKGIAFRVELDVNAVPMSAWPKIKGSEIQDSAEMEGIESGAESKDGGDEAKADEAPLSATLSTSAHHLPQDAFMDAPPTPTTSTSAPLSNAEFFSLYYNSKTVP